MINDSIKGLDIIIFNVTWNNTGIIQQCIKGFLNYKSENNFNKTTEYIGI